jgi:hypothetical protein
MKAAPIALSVALSLALPLPALADFAPVTSRDEFLSILGGRELRLGLFSIRLNVNPDGTILGSAMGWDVTGTWDWQDGYFCREMDWSGEPIPFNCQLVEVREDKLRFTVDKGAGDEATFNLR